MALKTKCDIAFIVEMLTMNDFCTGLCVMELYLRMFWRQSLVNKLKILYFIYFSGDGFWMEDVVKWLFIIYLNSSQKEGNFWENQFQSFPPYFLILEEISHLNFRKTYHIKYLLQGQTKSDLQGVSLLCHGPLKFVVVQVEVVEQPSLMWSTKRTYKLKKLKK